MIVWLASFPRSGNTFLRIVLHRLYGITTSVVYNVDGVARRVGEALVGYEDRPGNYEAMRHSEALHFIKTHRQRDNLVDQVDRAICLVRDGRDCLVSWARMQSETEPQQFGPQLRKMIERQGATGTGSWGANVLSWLQPPAAHRAVLRYEDLIADPVGSITSLMEHLVPGQPPVADATAPSFADLRDADARFFRRGIAGSHRDELPEPLHDLFWSRPDNVAAMRLLGLRR